MALVLQQPCYRHVYVSLRTECLPRTNPRINSDSNPAAIPGLLIGSPGAIATHRCSSFYAEAAVLVLVLALLERFMLKGRMEINWVVSAFAIRLTLLAASVFTEFSCRCWLSAPLDVKPKQSNRMRGLLLSQSGVLGAAHRRDCL